MNAKLNGAKRTGRAARVRAFLARQRKPVTAREILDAITAAQIAEGLDPDTDINLMSATLSTMSRGGTVERVGAGYGNVRWQLAARRQTQPPAPTPVRARPAAREPDQAAPVKAKAASVPKQPSPKVVQPVVRRQREQKTNFAAPLATVAQVARPNAAAGFESVDDFLRRGGRIQQLRPGECSQPLRFDHSRLSEQRAKGRTTQQRNRASSRN
mgnify:CR=1 FL=1